mmetsp:Transcript_20071/g.37792  ORF Transcript_20071/g.37792 Transcript_20071/m.37792 type:complete len:386 (-) Transcript_20071:724-1881(-)
MSAIGSIYNKMFSLLILLPKRSATLLLLLATFIANATTLAAIIPAIAIQPLIRFGWRCSCSTTSTTTAFLQQPRNTIISTAAHHYGRRRVLNTDIDSIMTTSSSSIREEAETAESAIQLLQQQKRTLRKQIRTRIKSSYPPSDSETATKLIDRSDLTFSRLFRLPQYQNAKSVGFFLSMPSGEIQTRNAIRRIAMKDGKELFVPRVGLDFEKCDMDLIRCDTRMSTGDDGDAASSAGDNGSEDGEDDELFYDSWPRNKWGIPEAPASTSGEDVAQPGDIDLLLVPGLAFDTHGHRLGQGKGYYDRFIARMRNGNDDGLAGSGDKKKKPFLIGVCLEEQFLEEVPHGIDFGGGGGGGDGGIIPVSDHDYIMDMVLTPSRTLDVPNA